MDDDLALRPQSIPDPPRRTWPPEWALPSLGNTSLRQARTPDPSPSLQGICEVEPGTSFCLRSSTSRPQLLASSATVPPEPAVYPSLPNTRPQSLNSVNSNCGRRTYDPEWKPSRSRSWSPCSRLGQSLHSRTACQKPNAGWCNSCGQQISSRTRTGASSPFRERYSTQEHTPTSTNLPTNQVVVSAVTTEVEAEDVVQLPMVRRRDRSSERATAELDRDHQLCQPAVSSSAEGSAAHRAPGRSCDRDCSHMADSTLVPDFDADGSCATNDNPESPSVISGSIEPSFSTARAAQESEVGPRRMEGLWRQQAAPSIPDNVLQLMCASVAPETLARYQQIIVSLTNYCGGIHCLDAASVSGFLEFTTRSTERPEATLRLARAAISFLADLQGRPAPDAAVVRRVHTALVATRTTKPRQATPVADVSMLVTYPKDLGSTEELPINELRQKAITLLSITAFCRPSDLACVARPSVLPDTARGTTNLSVCSRFRMDSIKWIDEGAELVFFGSKADKGMPGNTVLIERASDPDFCPITTLKAYINATATARLSVDDQPVFITLKKPYKGLSSSAIAQILSQVLKDSGQQQGVTARSIRPTGARKAIEQGVEATVVQRRGRWKSSDVFHRHYAGVTGPATDAVLNN